MPPIIPVFPFIASIIFILNSEIVAHWSKKGLYIICYICAIISHILLRLPSHCTIFETVELGPMPRVHRLNNCNVYVHPGDHAPPHFHALGPDWEVVLDIQTLEIRKGSAPLPDLRQIKEWSAQNREYLLNKWSEYNERDA